MVDIKAAWPTRSHGWVAAGRPRVRRVGPERLPETTTWANPLPRTMLMSGPRQQPKTAPQAAFAFPEAQGLFDPKREFDACGVGFIADLKARGTHKLVADALAILENLEHRGAVGADPTSGDGAGILVQIPHEFLKEQCAGLKIKLPKPGHYACGHLFMPQDEPLRADCERIGA